MTRIEPDATQPKQFDKSLGDLFGDLSREFGELVRTQTELAKTEIRAQTEKAKIAAGAFGGAAVAGYMALVLLSFAAAWGLSEVMPEGFAFLIVGVIYAVVAGVLYLRGRRQVEDLNIVPERTIESVKEDAQWAQQKTR
jgi:hypothetical protein